MKAFKELPSCLETRITTLDCVNGLLKSGQEDVGHLSTFPLRDPCTDAVSGDVLFPWLDPLPSPQLALELQPPPELPGPAP
jgi:hypothetical protein